MSIAVRAGVDLPKYELLGEIGHGGMATVYRARDRRLSREVAVKLIHPHLRRNPEVAERFVREATAVAKLRHRNIVEVYDISDEAENERYLVVELVRGPSLRERLRVLGRVVPEVAAALAMEVAAGLAHAHAQGVVHRDVKPENVLLECSEPEPGASVVRVKLTDFGIAKLLDAQGVTSTGQVLGSPAHMAPEQIEGRVVDGRTDVFALGVLLYECVVGRLPFEGQHPAQVLRRVLDGEFLSPDLVEPTVGAAYARIISRALAKEPDERFGTVQQFSEALREALATLGFDDPAALLDQLFHTDVGFEGRLVEKLSGRAEVERAAGRSAAASELLVRALAYRPGDRDLLHRLTSLRRQTRLGRSLRVALTAGAGAVVIAGSLVALERRGRLPSEPVAVVERPEFTFVTAAPEPLALPPEVPPGPPASVPEVPIAGPLVTRTAEGGPRHARPTSTANPAKQDNPEVPLPTRDVLVRLTGATGGGLRIDGQPRMWFGVTTEHSLSLGQHRFEFTAPNTVCCESTSKVVNVEPGTSPLVVVGEIPFKPATLKVVVDREGYGSIVCPTLFSAALRFPGEMQIPMSRVSATGSCTIHPEGASAPAPAPEQRTVILRAGEPTFVHWP